MCKYKNEIDKMCWSYSRLISFENCKYEFYLNYIVNDADEYLPEGNYYAEVGNFVHEILAKILEGKLAPNEALCYYIDNFENNVFYKTNQSIMDKTFETCANYFSIVDFSFLKDYEILGIEKKIKVKIAGYNFIGFIDLLLRDKKDNKIIIVDHKSSKYPFNKSGGIKKAAKSKFDSYKKQMYLYSVYVKEKYNEFPKELVWNHFKDNKFATIPFSKTEYNEIIKWFTDTIHTIEQEQDFYPNESNYFYCHNLCNFRNSCEYIAN